MGGIDRSGRWAAWTLPTPALVADPAVVDANIAAMARRAAALGAVLRPHAKTHKSPAVAARQLAAGAVGLSVATVGEAEVFASHGVDDLFVAYPLWASGDLGPRLATLAERARLAVGCDSLDAAYALAGAVGRRGALSVLVEVDCGLARSGVAPEAAGPLAAGAAAAGLDVTGVFTFPGHSYAPGAALGAADDERRALAEAAASLGAARIACRVRSGGSTPSAPATVRGAVSELRPGVYVYGDAQQVALGTCGPGDVGLAALATVVSAPAAGRIVLDAGAKVLGPDRPAWTPGHGIVWDLPGAVVTGLWEHHAVVDVGAVAPAERPRVGDRVAVVPNHVCTAVNLADVVHVVEGGRVVARWTVAARGKNR